MATGNSDRSQNLKPWKPGQSGNPSGRPRGIARQLRDAIHDDPTVLTDILLKIAYSDEAKDSDRIAAAKEYLDRGYGKAPSYAPVDGDPLELTSTDRAVSDVLDELAGRRQVETAGSSEGETLAGTG